MSSESVSQLFQILRKLISHCLSCGSLNSVEDLYTILCCCRYIFLRIIICLWKTQLYLSPKNSGFFGLCHFQPKVIGLILQSILLLRNRSNLMHDSFSFLSQWKLDYSVAWCHFYESELAVLHVSSPSDLQMLNRTWTFKCLMKRKWNFLDKLNSQYSLNLSRQVIFPGPSNF